MMSHPQQEDTSTTLHKLSFSQESLWFLHRMGDEGAYNESAGVWLHGALKLHLLQNALYEILRRHQALRCVVVPLDGAGMQRIQPLEAFSVPVLDLTMLPPVQKKQECLRFVKEESQRPFHLEKGPLSRFQVVRLSSKEHLLLITIHHICGDGWSLGILAQELQALYTAFLQGQASPLTELPLQYTAYTQWQHEQSQAHTQTTQLAYWKKALAGLPPLLSIPLDSPRPSKQRFRGATFPCHTTHEMNQALRHFCRESKLTAYMVSLSAFFVLLHRYSRMNDVVVGSPFANRKRKEHESLIGFFANTIVLRADFSEDWTVQEFLQQVRATTLNAYQHADLPFEKVVEAIQPERSTGHNPIFQVMFAWQPSEAFAEFVLPNINTSTLSIKPSTAKFDINLKLWDSPRQGLGGVWEYNSDLFEEETIQRMDKQFQLLLQNMLISPECRLSEIRWLHHAEEERRLQHWTVQQKWPSQDNIHTRFSQQAHKTPNAIALTDGHEHISYQELDQYSDQLANLLVQRGVGPETLVVMFVERHWSMLVGILGILKAGGAYVPIDPIYPVERVRAIVEDARPTVVLTQKKLLNILPEAVQEHSICLDEDWDVVLTQSSQPQVVENSAQQMAYVIYTSGSTGTPKGVIVQHDHVLRLFAATDAWFSFDHNDVWTLFHSYAFDFSVWEIWGALLHGGRLVIIPHLTSRDPKEFYHLLCEEGVTVLNQTPSAFQQLIQAEGLIGQRDDLVLRTVIFGGEALVFHRLAPWFERHGDQTPRLVNMYGITETTVHVTYRPLTLADLTTGQGSLIGEPIPDLAMFVLDPHQKPVPVGVPGELYVGGAGLARGYLHRPELTAQRFIQNPFRKQASDPARLYRTGDLVRLRSNGALEYIGRLDNQVKIRGFRIELGDIQATLLCQPTIQDAIVLIKQSKTGHPQIVAYLLQDTSERLQTNALRESIRPHLPSYMIPNAFIVLKEWPLTPNGKINRHALPTPSADDDQERQLVAPRSPVEAALVDIWQTLLGIRNIGVRDSFFALGGHSLLTLRLLARIEERLQAKLPLAAIFQHPTIEALAQVISAESPPLSSLLFPLQSQGKHLPLFFIPGSGGLASAFAPLARQFGQERPFYVFQRRGLNDTETPWHTISDIAQEYASILQDFNPEGPFLLGGHSLGAWIALETAYLLQQQGREITMLFVLDMPAPQTLRPSTEQANERTLQTLLTMAEGIAGQALQLSHTHLQELPREQQLTLLHEELLRLALVLPDTSIAQVRSIIEVLEADERALHSYRPLWSPSTFPITLFRSDMVWQQATLETRSDPNLGWGDWSTHPILQHQVTGGHSSMLQDPHVSELFKMLNERLVTK